MKHENKSVFYLITKANYCDKSSYQDIFNSFVNLKNLLIKKNLKSFSMQRMCNGFGQQLHWEKIRTMIRYIFRGTDIVINVFLNIITEPDKETISKILEEFHDNPIGGHSGFHRTYKRIRSTYKWTNMKTDIANYIKTCENCQRNK